MYKKCAITETSLSYCAFLLNCSYQTSNFNLLAILPLLNSNCNAKSSDIFYKIQQKVDKNVECLIKLTKQINKIQLIK